MQRQQQQQHGRRSNSGSSHTIRRSRIEHAISKKGSPYSITERRFTELIPVLGSQPASDVSHKPGGMLALLSARPVVTLK